MKSINLNPDKLYHYALCVMAISLSFPTTLFPIGVGLLAVAALYLRFKEKDFEFNKPLAIFYLCIFTYIVLRIIGNENIRAGFRVLDRNLPLLIIPILLIPSKLKNAKAFYKSFVIGISIASLVSMLGVGYEQFIAIDPEAEWYFTGIENYGFHSTYMALYALIAIIMLSERNLFSPRLSLGWIFFLSVFILFSSSRIVLIALVLLFIIKALASGKKVFYLGFALVLGILALLFTYSKDFRFKINQLKDFQGFSYYDNNNYGSVSLRVAKIKASIILWEENKWFGVGTGDYRDAMVRVYRSEALECWPCARARYNSHNQYLNTLAAHGIVGFSILALWVLYLWIIAWRTKDSLLFGVLLAFMIISLTDSSLEFQRGVVIIFLMLYFIPTVKKIDLAS